MPKTKAPADRDDLRHLSAQAFAALGAPYLAYINRVEAGGTVSYAIHAADGTVLAVVPDREVAFAAARQNGLEPVSVH
ncbi:MAG: DUF1150 family protein [Alphaproteobacteria bacterium]